MGKLRKLKGILKKMGSLVIAYSGGVDSAFLLKVAHDVLGDRVLAVTAVSPTYPIQELIPSKKLAKALRVKHRIIRTDELKDKRFIANPLNRCYFCKKELFSRLKKMAGKFRLNFVADATNLSDKNDFRPGNLAKKELGVRSPLYEAGFTKKDIRIFSKRQGLETWNKPQLACLASRIPYGVKITPQILKRIDRAETTLRNMGFRHLRLRHCNGLCRIEVDKKDIPVFVLKRSSVVKNLKRLGYHYITLDLEGYRAGSLNEVIKK